MSQDTICPKVAVDCCIFSMIENRLAVYLMQIDNGPYQDKWALPGSLVRLNETFNQAIERTLSEKTNLKSFHLEQLYTFGDPDRDIRGHSISVSYFALVPNPESISSKSDQKHIRRFNWFNIDKLPKLAFDHKKIIELAKSRLENKMSYSNIVYSLLPEKFTFLELQKIYENIWQKPLDKRNFRKKMLSLGIIVPTKEISSGARHRPATFYRFSERKLVNF